MQSTISFAPALRPRSYPRSARWKRVSTTEAIAVDELGRPQAALYRTEGQRGWTLEAPGVILSGLILGTIPDSIGVMTAD